MATITATKITESGIASSMTACATGSGGDEFVNTGQEFIRVQNTHASATYTVKVQVQKSTVEHPVYGSLTKGNIYKAVSSPGSSGANSMLLGPFKQGSFNNASNKVKVFYKAGTGLTDTAFDALTDIAGAHLLKIEVLYL